MSFFHVEAAYVRHLQLQGLCNFRDFFYHDGGKIVGRHRLRNVVRIDLGGFRGFLKRECKVRWKDRWLNWWAGFGLVSKSRREWQILHTLRAHGFEVPQPLAVGEDRDRAFLLLRELPQAIELRSCLRAARGDTPQRTWLIQAVAKAIARLHAAGFTHPDLYAKHIFINIEQHSIRLIDFQRTCSPRALSWNERWHDLAALDASLSERLVSSHDRLTFLTTYLRASGPGTPGRPLLRQAITAVTRRTAHLLNRRRIRDMRKEPAGDRIEAHRVTWHDGGLAVHAALEREEGTHGLAFRPPVSRLPTA